MGLRTRILMGLAILLATGAQAGASGDRGALAGSEAVARLPAATCGSRTAVSSLGHEQAVVYDALYELVELAALARGPASHEQELFVELQSLEVPDDTAEIEAIARVVLRQLDPDKLTPESDQCFSRLSARQFTQLEIHIPCGKLRWYLGQPQDGCAIGTGMRIRRHENALSPTGDDQGLAVPEPDTGNGNMGQWVSFENECDCHGLRSQLENSF